MVVIAINEAFDYARRMFCRPGSLSTITRLLVGLYMGLPKYPRRALHLSGSEARFGGVHFSGPPRFSPLMIFFGFFFAKFGSCGLKLP